MRSLLCGATVSILLTALSGCPGLGSLGGGTDFVGAPREGVAPLTVFFTASPSKYRDPGSPGSTVIAYFWTFGDGGVGQGKTATHVYTQPGTYDVSLTVLVQEEPGTGALGLSKVSRLTEYKEDYITVLPVNVGPVADAGPVRTVSLGETATLDGSGSFDLDGDPLTYAWEVTETPDGSALTTASLAGADTESPSITPDVGGTYRVELTVSDGQLDDTDATTVVATTAANDPPVADAGDDLTSFLNQTVSLGRLRQLRPGRRPDQLRLDPHQRASGQHRHAERRRWGVPHLHRRRHRRLRFPTHRERW